MAAAHPGYPAVVMPENVERMVVKIWSEGSALDADLFLPRGLRGDQRVPGVVLSHGWGGTKGTCERYAALFASAGMITLAFTHRGWGSSGGAIREVVDPLSWIQSYRSAVDYLEGEPNVDIERLGAWGTSFGGGIAMYTAANDERIKALAVQVAMVGQLSSPRGLAYSKKRAVDLARGTLGPLVAAVDALEGLPGSAHLPHMLQYHVIDHVPRLTVPTLMMDAGNEKMFDRKQNCILAHQLLQAAGVATRLDVIPGIEHYGIYFEGYEEGSTSALAWFRKYLEVGR